ncbi:FtsX-like permease family protein [Paenibacillus chartarius]|uniref:FtsX-like permease family protein n=1 Tax=Paenibacillus chartarius TaxID=747481 RepID=A0ABV6DLL8_9BACL
MNISQLIRQNLKANLKHYYLYVFALIFSVALYFAFVTLQYDPALEHMKGSIKGAAAIRTASILLVAIVAVFNLYANNIFIKRRSKEIGLLQLIGMTKGTIFRILSVENGILYFGALIAGVFAGFSVSKLVLMILFKIIEVEALASLRWSNQALVQTVAVFAAIYVLIMLVSYTFIKRQSILGLFRFRSQTEDKPYRITVTEIVIGAVGLIMIVTGYYVSSKLFSGDYTTTTELFVAMSFILASVIVGTYLFYKGSVRLILHEIRKRKGGLLTVREVLSLSSVMFRMRSNALLLTVITTLSALAIGLLSLSYISYYSAEKTAEQSVPAHFAFTGPKEAEQFIAALDAERIEHRETRIETLQAYINLSKAVENQPSGLLIDPSKLPVSVIADTSANVGDMAEGQAVLSGYSDIIQKFMTIKNSGPIQLMGAQNTIDLSYTELRKEFILSWYFTNGGEPTVIVDAAVFERLKTDLAPEIQKKSSVYIGVDIADKSKLAAANEAFHRLELPDEDFAFESRLDMSTQQKANMGLIMFIVAFLGLAFLITSGCILYFKQMDESEEEKPSCTILRKLGFSPGDLLAGIRMKQVLSFGIPLAVGLVHSYFAVQSGWFLFGTELWTPMFAVMLLYTVLYSVFGILSVLHYKKVIRGSL